MRISFWVPGEPAPKGSKTAFKRGDKIVLVESSKSLKPFMDAGRHVAAMHMTDKEPLKGSLGAAITFYVTRPASVTRSRPNVKPDIDKLARAVLDFCEQGGCFLGGDQQVVELHARKFYADDLQTLEPGRELGSGVHVALYNV